MVKTDEDKANAQPDKSLSSKARKGNRKLFSKSARGKAVIATGSKATRKAAKKAKKAKRSVKPAKVSKPTVKKVKGSTEKKRINRFSPRPK